MKSTESGKQGQLAHLVLKDVGRETDSFAVHMCLDEGKRAADAVKRDVRESEVGRHVDEVQAVRHQFSIAYTDSRQQAVSAESSEERTLDEHDIRPDLFQQVERRLRLSEVVSVKAL